MNRTDDARHFRELRMRLVDCARTLRSAKDSYDQIKALIEQHNVEHGHIIGKNAEERSRQMITRLIEDDEYQDALAQLREAEYDHDRASELLEAAKDERRAAEWQIRARLADALFSRGVQGDEDAGSDEAFDDVANEWEWQGITEEYATRIHGQSNPCYCEKCKAERKRADAEIPF